MNTALVLHDEYDPLPMDYVAPAMKADKEARQEQARWTTRQVMAACLWSAFFGLAFGYGWLLLQIGTTTCR